MEHNISIDEAFLLKVIKDMYSSVKFESITEDNYRYIWIYQKMLHEEVPILGTLRNLKRKLEKLEEKGCIKKIVRFKKGNQGGSFSYIRPTKLADELTDYEIDNSDKKERGDKSVMGGMTNLSPGVGQNCHTKDHMFKDPLYIYHKQHRQKKYKNNKDLVDVVLKKKNINQNHVLYNPVKNIIENFKAITNKTPNEKDIMDVCEILTDQSGVEIDLAKKESIAIKTMSKSK